MAIPYLLTTYLPGSSCIGDSRITINSSFSALDTAVQNLSAGLIPSLSTTNILISSVLLTNNQQLINIIGNSNLSVYESLQNTNAGISASTDISVYNDGGVNYLDLGINSSNYNGNSYSPKFNIVGSGDSYLYSTANDLAIGTSSTGTNNDLIFFTGGSLSGTSVNSGNERMRITNVGGTYAGNVGINTSFPNQQLTVSGNVSATGFASVSALQINNAFSTGTGVGSIAYKFPIYNASGTLLGYVPIYNS
jgi:hypothetical protein